jgi:hypothetical protein
MGGELSIQEAGGAVTRNNPARADFLRDDRGVIMVIGTILSFFMIGTVWYVLGIGNVINYREQLQNATDASAFAGAVYDARGMNLLAFINIFMGFLMSLIVVAKIMQVVFWIGWAANCSACDPFDPFSWLQCFECTTYDPELGLEPGFGDPLATGDVPNYVGGVESAVWDTLTVLHVAEEGIAIIWPWVSASKSEVAGTYYANGVAVTTSFAYSQIPVNIDRIGSPGSVEAVVDAFGDGSLDPITNGIPTSRLGLPVDSAKYTDLCKMGIIDVASLDGIIPSGFLSFISGVIAEVLYAMDNFFCDAASGGGIGGAIGDLINGIGTILGLGLHPNGTVSNSTYTYSPMQLYDGDGDGALKAKMGDGYFGVWATGLGVFTNVLDSATKGLKVAQQQSHTGTVIGDPPKDAIIGLALGEFYYDPKNNEHGTGAQSNETSINLMDIPNHNVLWNLRWRARIRRYHGFPEVGVFNAFHDLFSGNLSGAATFAEQTAAGYANSELMKTAIGDALGEIEGNLSQNVQNILENGGASENTVTDTIPPAKLIYH